MSDAPKVIVEQDNSGATPFLNPDVNKIILLLESPDGPSLNADGILMKINGPDENSRLGRNLASNPALDVIAMFQDIARVPLYVGRVTGAGGAKAATADINDFNGVPAATLKGNWRGLGTEGNLYALRVSRGAQSTTDTGAGRVDTKLEIIEIATSRVVAVQDRLVMNTASERYALTVWNAQSSYPATLTDLNAADTYQNTDEPAVGTYNFTGGTAPAAATATERQAAIDALDAAQTTKFAIVGFWSWGATECNYAAGKAAAKLWTIIDYLADGTTPAAALTRRAAITSANDRVAMHAGWGKSVRNSSKRIPGIAQVLGQAVVAARFFGGRGVNTTGANQAVDMWTEFDPVSETQREAFADARTNPLYMVNNRYQRGVVIGDVLALYNTDARYAQWGSRRGDDLILSDVIAYLENRVALNGEYLFGPKVAGVNAPISVATLSKIDGEITRLFAEYPPTLLTGGRGVGWDWFGDVQNGVDGPEPIFLLGTDIAKVGRIFKVKIGRVEGRFTVLSTQVAEEV